MYKVTVYWIIILYNLYKLIQIITIINKYRPIVWMVYGLYWSCNTLSKGYNIVTFSGCIVILHHQYIFSITYMQVLNLSKIILLYAAIKSKLKNNHVLIECGFNDRYSLLNKIPTLLKMPIVAYLYILHVGHDGVMTHY